jgi:N-carbamoyl-L-amino-acid hydrolase
MSIAEGIRVVGGDPDRLELALRGPDEFAAFIELHIEQGAFLHEEGIEIGVVEGIVGIRWWDVVIEGIANHAGTTPMNRRQDAMLSAAESPPPWRVPRSQPSAESTLNQARRT